MVAPGVALVVTVAPVAGMMIVLGKSDAPDAEKRRERPPLEFTQRDVASL